MENLFDAFRGLSVEEQAYEIAFLSVISNESFAKEIGSRAKNAGIKAVNTISNLIGKGGMNEVTVTTQQDMVMLCSEELLELSDEERMEKLKAVLWDKLTLCGETDIPMEEELFSLRIMKEAGIAVGNEIGASGTPCQKADDVVKSIVKKQVADYKVAISSAKLARELLGHFIWKVTPDGKQYLPEGIEASEEEVELDKKFFALMREKSAQANNLSAMEREVLNIENKILGNISAIKDLEEKLIFVDKRMSEYEIEGLDPESADFVSAKSVKSITEDELSMKKHEKEDYEIKQENLKKEILDIKNAEKARDEEIDCLAAQITDIVKKSFAGNFALTVENDAIEKLVRVYNVSDRKILSSVLKELAMTYEPTELADVKDGADEFKMSFVLSSRALGRIKYILDDGKIIVTSVLKIKRA